MAMITVTAGEGRTFPVHHTIATAPGGALQLIRPGDELEVDDSHTTIQRALRNGDLVRVASPRPRTRGERFSAAIGPLPAIDPTNTGSHNVEPQKGS